MFWFGAPHYKYNRIFKTKNDKIVVAARPSQIWCLVLVLHVHASIYSRMLTLIYIFCNLIQNTCAPPPILYSRSVRVQHVNTSSLIQGSHASSKLSPFTLNAQNSWRSCRDQLGLTLNTEFKCALLCGCKGSEWRRLVGGGLLKSERPEWGANRRALAAVSPVSPQLWLFFDLYYAPATVALYLPHLFKERPVWRVTHEARTGTFRGMSWIEWLAEHLWPAENRYSSNKTESHSNMIQNSRSCVFHFDFFTDCTRRMYWLMIWFIANWWSHKQQEI